MFEILFEKSAFKFLSNIDAKNRQRISEAIENLAEDPFPHDVKRIYGTNEKLFRIRVGEFRVLYRIDYGEIVIVIVDIDSRKRVYKGIWVIAHYFFIIFHLKPAAPQSSWIHFQKQGCIPNPLTSLPGIFTGHRPAFSWLIQKNLRKWNYKTALKLKIWTYLSVISEVKTDGFFCEIIKFNQLFQEKLNLHFIHPWAGQNKLPVNKRGNYLNRPQKRSLTHL